MTDGRETSDVTCLACGCLCDDLSVAVLGRAVVEVRNGCPVGRAWFEAAARSGDGPEATVDGKATTTREAIARAAEILESARAPIVFGLTSTVTETSRAALELAERLRGCVVLDRSAAELGRVAAFQRQGRVSATLGEVKNRADVVVFWGADPIKTHPRHWERYSVAPKGRFVPEGWAGRFVVVVGDGETETAERADLVIPVDAKDDVGTINALRLLVQGKVPRREDGRDVAHLEALADRLRGARFGALFFQSRAAEGDRSGADWESANRLTRDLNDVTRAVLLGMGGPGNTAGAEAALTWQSGFLQGVDYRLGTPTPLDDRGTLDDRLRSREPDAVVLVGADFPSSLSADARDQLRAIPTIAIGPNVSAADSGALVAINSARAGYDAGGTVVRCDGVGLPVRPVCAATRPSDGDVIRLLLAALAGRREGLT